MIAAVAVIATLAVLVAVLFILGKHHPHAVAVRQLTLCCMLSHLTMVPHMPGVIVGHTFQRFKHKLPCCLTLRSSELDEVLVTHHMADQIQTKPAVNGRQRIAISASTTQSLESAAGVTLIAC